MISTLGKGLSCRQWSTKEKETKAAKREKRNGVGLMNRVISRIMYRTAVSIGKISPDRTNRLLIRPAAAEM